MNLAEKREIEHEVMAMSNIDKISALAALRTSSPLRHNCLKTTERHVAAVRSFLTDNNVDLAKCDFEKAAAILGITRLCRL